MAAFTRKQSHGILVPSLPLRLLMLPNLNPNLCHVTSRPQTDSQDFASLLDKNKGSHANPLGAPFLFIPKLNILIYSFQAN